MRYADSQCSYTETNEPHNYVFTGPCVYCSQAISVVVAGPELYNYRQGEYIQNALSNNSDEREFLMSGICPACWSEMFSTDEMLSDHDGDGPNPSDECDGCGQPHIECECEETDSFRDDSEGLTC